MKQMVLFIFFLIFYLLFSSISSTQTDKKIDIFNYSKIQNFDINENEFKSEIKKFENKMKDDDFFKKIKIKEEDLNEFTGALQKYSVIKSKNNLKNTKSESKPNTIEPEKPKLINKTKIKSQSLNAILPNEKLINKANKEQLFLSDENMIPEEECNKYWDYTFHGQDWLCTCQNGKNQSPINIPTSKHSQASQDIKRIYNNIFFDLKDAELSCPDKENCKYPLIKNTGTDLTIEDDCGVLVMPQHMNGYKCFKIEIHSPSEHKLDNQSFDLEIQIYFKLEDKRIIDNNTKDYITVVVLFRGFDEDNINTLGLADANVVDHPFLESLNLDILPKSKGHARLLSNSLNYNLLFDESIQPYRLKNKPNISNIIDDQSSKVKKAISDLIYDKNHLLSEFYLYNGSMNKPPCDENVQYIINANYLFAPMDQILKISKVLLESGNKTGNNREIQNSQGIKIYYYRNSNNLTQNIINLDLKDKKRINLEDPQNDEDLDFKIDFKNIPDEEKLVDKVVDIKHTSLNKILALSKLQ